MTSLDFELDLTACDTTLPTHTTRGRLTAPADPVQPDVTPLSAAEREHVTSSHVEVTGIGKRLVVRVRGVDLTRLTHRQPAVAQEAQVTILSALTFQPQTSRALSALLLGQFEPHVIRSVMRAYGVPYVEVESRGPNKAHAYYLDSDLRKTDAKRSDAADPGRGRVVYVHGRIFTRPPNVRVWLSRSNCVQILSTLTDTPRTAAEIASLTGGRFDEKMIRAVMRAFRVPHLVGRPHRYRLPRGTQS